ncbi:MAG: DUF2145 domain-containing protein [Gallionella sp.]|nr:DUF2145 domain-containing protein [Gallionella sp.]MDD4960425.1 DUF2145 domain-containing protein [Gallionella sp.]
MKTFLHTLLIISLLIGLPVQAGGSLAGGEVHFPVDEIIQFSKQVERKLAEKGARVALIARVGRLPEDLPEGMHFTHVSFAIYSKITTQDGRTVPGYAVYNLYQNNEHPDTSALVQDFPVDFFSGVVVLEAGVIIPSPELQKRLLDVISSDTYRNLHDPHYSAIANPFTLGRQNCTEHTLDVLNAAIYQTSDIQLIKASERAYFIAQPVNVNPLKLILGSMFSAEITLSDHPKHQPETATFETIARYLQQYDEGSEVFYVSPENQH